MYDPISPRNGEVLSIKDRHVPYSYWPVSRTPHVDKLQSTLFAIDPWTIIRDSINRNTAVESIDECRACLVQARELFKSASESSVISSRPLQIYYSFLNLAKCFCLARGSRSTFDRAHHGLAEQLAPGGSELQDAYLEVHKSTSSHVNIFDEFVKSISDHRFSNRHILPIPHIIPQIVPGHRVWAKAAGETERFLSVSEIYFMECKEKRRVWAAIHFHSGDLKRLNITPDSLMSSSIIRENRHLIDYTDGFVSFEDDDTVEYAKHATEDLQKILSNLKKSLWVTVGSSFPFRRYYIYMSPESESGSLLPQLASIYAIAFYLSSITRYRPHHFSKILDGPFGSRIEEFITGQPNQFLYLMASEFAEQDVSRPSIV